MGAHEQIIHLDLTPSFERRPDGSRVLVEVWAYEDVEGIIRLHPGFITDFSSVPNRMSSLMPPWWMMDLAGLAHDGGYREAPFSPARRKRWDRAWWRIAMAQGNSRYSAWKGYAGLRIGGSWAYGWRNRWVKELGPLVALPLRSS
jgi:hypothetical protein